MNIFRKALVMIILSMILLSCQSNEEQGFEPKEIYKSDDLAIMQITNNSFIHLSYLATDDFGNVPCNGLIIRSNGEVIVFDTPTNDESSEELIHWINETLHCKIKAVIPTHFHIDCLGGLNAFEKHNIPSYAYAKTLKLAQENSFPIPQNSFKDSLVLAVGDKMLTVNFFGEGHTIDNVVGYFPSEKLMYGGCLIKELEASKGNLEDANEAAWSRTVMNVKKRYPDVKVIVPGHGHYGDSQLLDYTIDLFK